MDKPLCAHKSIVYRPVGGTAIGWQDRWICEHCAREFAPILHPRHARIYEAAARIAAPGLDDIEGTLRDDMNSLEYAETVIRDAVDLALRLDRAVAEALEEDDG